ncbi:MAG: secretin N-terminal domain-containing protein [Thermogutta sp.]
MNVHFASLLKIERMLVLAIGLVILQSIPFAARLRAADYDVVGVLAIAIEPEVSEQLGLTENQLAQLQDLIAEKEAEVLTLASELRNLPPQERKNRLAEFRYLAENAGLNLLSSQQRSKLEQMRLKRYGLGVLADPVVARRLQISPDQAAAIQQSLGQATAANGVTANGGSARDAAIVQVLNESQRQALRAMLLGELPLESTPPSSDAAARMVTQDEPPANVGIPDQLEEGAVAPAAPVPAVPEDEMLPEISPLPAAPVVESSQPKEEGKAAQESTLSGPVAQNPDMIGPNGGVGKMVAMESEQEKAEQPSPKPDQPENTATPLAAQRAPIEAEAKPETTFSQGEPHGKPDAGVAAEEKSPLPVAEGKSGEEQMGAPLGEPAKAEVAARPSPDAPAQPSAGEQKAQQDAQPQPAPVGTTTQDQKPQEVKVETPTAAEPKAISGAGDSKSVTPAASSGTGSGGAPVGSSKTTEGGSDQGGVATVAQVPQLPPADVKLRFNFRYQPWKEVLDWLAQQAGLSLVMESPPPGTFNYVDDHEFTATQAIDLLNSVLLTKGYVLVRRERMLMLFNVDDGVPPNLVDTVTPEDLEKRGNYEMVSCLFQLRRMTPEEAEQEVKKLLGPQGSVVVLGKAKQLFVTETAGRLKTIRRMLDAIENPSANDMVRTFRVNPATVDQVLSIVRQMFQIPPDQTANADGTLRFAVDPGASRLLVSGSPEMLDRFSQLLQALDPSATDGTAGLESTPQLEVYPITSADPQMVLQVFQTLLAGMPDVRLAIDPKTGALVAWARPAQHATIRATLQQLQGEVGQVEVIPLRVVDPQLAVLAISKLFGSAGESTSGGSAPTVDADVSTRMLLVRGTKAQIEQIRQLLIKMGEPADASAASNLSLMRTIPMDVGTAQAILDQMQSLWPQVRPNRLQVIRSVVPSESDGAPPATGQGEQSPRDDGRTERGVEARRIPLPDVMTSGSRLLLGLKPQTSASSTSSSTTSGSYPTPQQPSYPQPWPGQSPFYRPWGPPGGFSPGGGPGFFDRRSEFDRHDHSRDGWRGSDRTTYSNQDTKLVVAASDVANESRSNWDNLPATRIRVAARLVSTEKNQEETAGSGGDNASTESPQAAGATGVTAVEEAKSEEPGSALDSTPISAQPQEATEPAPQTESAQPPAPPPVIVAVTPEGLVVASQDPDALNQFENLVRRMASQNVSQYAGPELVVYYLKNSKAESVASILDQILGGGTLTSSGSTGGSLVGEIARAAFGNVGGGLVGSLLGIDTETGSSTSTSSSTRTSSRVQITPDARLNALIVQAYPQDLQLIEEILRVLDQQDTPQEVAVQPRTVIIPVKNTQAEEIAGILRSVYQDRLVTAASANRGPSPQEIIQLLRGGGRGGPGGARNQPQEEVQRMSIGVDVRTNSLIISAPERLLSEVRQLVEQLDQKAVTESEETTQVVTLQKASPESVRAALSALLGSGVQIRGGTGSSPWFTSSSQTSTYQQGSSSSTSRTQPRGFGFPTGQMPYGGFRPTTQFRGSMPTRSSSRFSGRTGGR